MDRCCVGGLLSETHRGFYFEQFQFVQFVQHLGIRWIRG